MKKDFTVNDNIALKEIDSYKWADGYTCSLCGGLKFYYQSKKPFTRKCQNPKCKKSEPPTARTVFHGLSMPPSASLEVVRLLSKQTRYTPAQEVQATVFRSIGVEVKIKSIWEFMHKVYDNMDIEEVAFSRDILVIKDKVTLFIGYHGETKKYYACFENEMEKYMNEKLFPEANYSICSIHGTLYKGKGKETTGMYDIGEEIENLGSLTYSSASGNIHRDRAYLKLYAFAANNYSYETLMRKLTTGYLRNPELLF